MFVLSVRSVPDFSPHQSPELNDIELVGLHLSSGIVNVLSRLLPMSNRSPLNDLFVPKTVDLEVTQCLKDDNRLLWGVGSDKGTIGCLFIVGRFTENIKEKVEQKKSYLNFDRPFSWSDQKRLSLCYIKLFMLTQTLFFISFGNYYGRTILFFPDDFI